MTEIWRSARVKLIFLRSWRGALPVRVCFILVMVLAACAGCDASSNVGTDPAAQQKLEEGVATLINLNGRLCARVVYMSPELSTGERQVNCEEYRDPQKARTRNNIIVYMVDLRSGTVRLMGRG